MGWHVTEQSGRLWRPLAEVCTLSSGGSWIRSAGEDPGTKPHLHGYTVPNPTAALREESGASQVPRSGACQQARQGRLDPVPCKPSSRVLVVPRSGHDVMCMNDGRWRNADVKKHLVAYKCEPTLVSLLRLKQLANKPEFHPARKSARILYVCSVVHLGRAKAD